MDSRDDDSRGHTRSCSSLRDTPLLEPQKIDHHISTTRCHDSHGVAMVQKCLKRLPGSFPYVHTTNQINHHKPTVCHPSVILDPLTLRSWLTLRRGLFVTFRRETSGEPPETCSRRLPMPLGGSTWEVAGSVTNGLKLTEGVISFTWTKLNILNVDWEAAKQCVIMHVLPTKHFVRVLLADHFSRRQLYVVTPVVLARFNLVGTVFNAGQSKVFKVLPCF